MSRLLPSVGSLPSTANTHVPTPFGRRRVVHALAAVYVAVWAVAAVRPVDRAEWVLENLLPLSAVAFLALSYRRLQLSDVSYAGLTAFLVIHAVGAHFGYEAVPGRSWLPAWLGLGGGGVGGARNNYDRLVHLAFGLCVVYPLRELLLWRTRRARGWASLFAAETVVALAALYEILEWLVAAAAAPELGRAFVGAQDDAWDAQKDVALAAVGAVATLLATELLHRWAAHAWPWRYLSPPPVPWAITGDRRQQERRAA